MILLGLTLLLIPLSAAASRFLASNITILLEARVRQTEAILENAEYVSAITASCLLSCAAGMYSVKNKLTADVEEIKCLAELVRKAVTDMSPYK